MCNLKFGIVGEDNGGHKISKIKICSSEILVTRLNIFLKFRTLAHISKMAAKTTSGYGLTSYSYSTPPTWSKTDIISRVPPTFFEVFEAKVQKF